MLITDHGWWTCCGRLLNLIFWEPYFYRQISNLSSSPCLAARRCRDARLHPSSCFVETRILTRGAFLLFHTRVPFALLHTCASSRFLLLHTLLCLLVMLTRIGLLSWKAGQPQKVNNPESSRDVFQLDREMSSHAQCVDFKGFDNNVCNLSWCDCWWMFVRYHRGKAKHFACLPCGIV